VSSFIVYKLKLSLVYLHCSVTALNKCVKEWWQHSEFRRQAGAHTQRSIVTSAVNSRCSVKCGANENRLELCQLSRQCKEWDL